MVPLIGLVIALAFSGAVNVYVALMLWQTHKRLTEVSEKYKKAVIQSESYRDYAMWLERQLYRVTKSHTHVGASADFRFAIREEYDNDVKRRADRSR